MGLMQQQSRANSTIAIGPRASRTLSPKSFSTRKQSCQKHVSMGFRETRANSPGAPQRALSEPNGVSYRNSTDSIVPDSGLGGVLISAIIFVTSQASGVNNDF